MHLKQKISTQIFSKFIGIFFIISLAFTFTAFAGGPDLNGIMYVKTIASGDGSGDSWNNATSDLQAAINTTGVQQVWVAGGTYKPKYRADNMSGANANDRDNAFVLKKDVKVYGGFAGTETVLTDRDLTIAANASILSGDLGTANDNTDNAYHIVLIDGDAGTSNTTELNGFTIKDGNANGTGAILINTTYVDRGQIGGISIVNSTPILTNVTITGNNGNTCGGLVNDHSNSILTNVIISGNTTSSEGAGIYNWVSSPILTNVTIIGNTAKYGGGIYNYDNSSPILTNVTISGNTATNSGGGIYSRNASQLTIRNSIIYGNNSGIVDNGLSSVISYSLVQGSTDVTNGNIDGSTDPKFVDAPNGDYRLQNGSPVINKGNNTYFDADQTPDLHSITTDLMGTPRFYNTTVDLGAYENQGMVPDLKGIIYVKPTALGREDGSSWANATADLQKSINTSGVQQVWVAGGTYLPIYMAGDGTTDRDKAFVLKKDVKVYGGFAGTELLLSERNLSLTANASILSGDLGTANDNTDNAYHVVISAGAAGAAELNGFTIKNGNANTFGSITVNSVSSIMENNGGGVCNMTSSPILTNLSIIENNVTSNGGGIYNSGNSSPILTNVKVSGNMANFGGGIYNNINSSPTLTNVIISGNTASFYGGGICNYLNCLPTLTNTTISGNVATDGGGIANYMSSNPIIRNSIIYGNNTGLNNSGISPVITYSLVQGSSDVTNGNIDGSTDPLFVSPQAAGLSTGGNYRLQDGSPVINKGNNTYFDAGQTPDLHLITTDFDGNPRIYGPNIDLGAYENQTNTVPVTMLSFTAKAENSDAKLEWKTTSESNNREFVISHSVDGKTFKEIGKVAGAGTSSTEKDYVFYDNNPAQGINYYRLQQVDFDGRMTDHGVRKVEFSVVTGLVKIYPNPVRDFLKIEFTAGKYQQIELADNSGRVLQRINLNAMDNQKTINLSTQSSGVYFVRLIGEKVMVQKVVKE